MPADLPTTIEYYGGCPTCGGTDGYLNIGANHWFVCIAHGHRWNPCSATFSHDDDAADRTAAEATLAALAIVEPIYPAGHCQPCTIDPEASFAAAMAVFDEGEAGRD